MAPTPSVKIVKTTAYKGGTKTWTNRYHFSGGVPADLTHWTTLVGNIEAAEKLCSSSFATYVEAICYDAGSDLPLHTISLSGVGGITGSGADFAPPLEVCCLLRWTTDQRTAKNHPIYLFTYNHACIITGGGSNEAVKTGQVTAGNTYAAAWVSGFSDGTNTYKRAGPNGAVAQSGLMETYATHRDFRN